VSTLTKQDIIQAKDSVLEKIEVPEWGGSVYMRSITAAERGQIEASAARFRESKGKDEVFARTFTVKIVAMALCDEAGARLFSDEEVSKLAQKNAKVVAKLSEVAQHLSGFAKEDIEQLEKNSPSAQPEDSLSA
jgi:hypothetical protein